MTLTAEKPAEKATKKTTRPGAESAKARFGNATIVLSERDFDRLFRCSSHRLLMAGRGELRSLFEHGGNLYAILAADEALAESSRAFRVRLGEAVRVVFADDYQGEALPFSVEAMLHEDRLEGMAVQHQGIGYVMTGGGVTFTTELAETPTPVPAPKRPNPIHELGTGEANRPAGQGQTWYQWCSSFGLPGGSAAWESERTANGPAWQAYLRGLKASEYRKELERQPRSWHAWCAEFEIPGTPDEWDRVQADGGPAWGMYLRGLRASGHHETAAALEEARKATAATVATVAAAAAADIPQGIETPSRQPVPVQTPAPAQTQIPPIDKSFCTLPTRKIGPSVYNPRQVFDEEELSELAASIKESGLLQPITVRPIPLNVTNPEKNRWIIDSGKDYRNPGDTVKVPYWQILDRTFLDMVNKHYTGKAIGPFWSLEEAQDNLPRYEIVAGERRWRASKLAGMETIDALIHPIDDETAKTLAVIENLQRKDLNPFDEARGFRQLMDIGWSQGKIAEKVGCNQSRVSKTLNLTRLPDDVQALIREGKLTPSHGERLVRFADFPALCSAIAEKTAAQQSPVAVLDGKNIPWAYDMEQKKLLKQLYFSSMPFDPAICRKCPFGAFRAGTTNDYGTCLKPDHYIELEREATAAQQASLKAAREAMERETRETTGRLETAAPSVSTASGSGEIPAQQITPAAVQKAAAIKHLPMLSSLKYDSYENLSHKSNLPDACTGECPCRAMALQTGSDNKQEPVSICTNPARFKQLQAAQSKVNNKASRAAFAAREKAAQEVLALNPLMGNLFVAPAVHRQVVVAVWDTLRSAGKTAVEPAAKRLGIEIDFDLWDKHVDGYSGRPALWDRLEKMPICDLIRLTVEAYMAREILAKFSYGSPTPADKLNAIDWITSATESTVSEVPA